MTPSESNSGKYAIAAVVMLIVVAVIWVLTLLPPKEITITGTVTISRSHDYADQDPFPTFIRFISANSGVVYEQSFSGYTTGSGNQEAYSIKLPNGQAYRIEIGWAGPGNVSGTMIMGTYFYNQPAGQAIIIKDFIA